MSQELSDRELDVEIATKIMNWRWMRLAPHLTRGGSTYGRMLRPPESEASEFDHEHMELAELSDPLYEHGENIDPQFRNAGEWYALVPHYSTEIASAMEVMNHLRPQYEDSFVGFYQLRDGEGELISEWEASCVFERGIELPNARVLAVNPEGAIAAMARAICLAALRAVNGDAAKE